MPFSQLPAVLTSFLARLPDFFHVRTAARIPSLLLGALFATGRRTVTSWFRAAAITAEFRPAYHALCALGRQTELPGVALFGLLRARLDPRRLLVAVDDSPTARYGPFVEGAGVHHNPTPGPAGERFLYGHVFVSAAVLARHPRWGSVALPLRCELYVRLKDLPKLPPERRRPFRTKLQLAAAQLAWLAVWFGRRFEQRWVVADGGYAKRPFLKPAREHGFTVVSRLRKDAALLTLPAPKPPGQRGPQATYGKRRISLAMRAGQRRGWQHVECEQYGRRVTKKVKTFLATWRPAGGAIRVVLVEEQGGWLPYFCTDPEASVVEILEAAADRGAHEQAFKDLKEVWGAGQQQVRNLDSNVAAFHVNGWMYSLTEAWAWDKPEAQLVRRQRCPWDDAGRRPSHADKRKALQREVLHGEISQALSGRPSKAEIRQLIERLLDLAA
jgi:DDE superfamily endonuclease